MTQNKRSTQSLRTPKQQRGAATLVLAMILLFGMTLIAFYLNKSMIFEQKTSANQLRSTKAFEAAEAGIEWATAMLNDSQYSNAICTTTGTNTQSFRKKYLPYTTGSGFTPVSTVQPGCSISTTGGTPTLDCKCPVAGSNPALNSTTDPTFTVKLEAVNATNSPGATLDSKSVLLTSYGCTAADGRCVPGATNSADAYQKISVILKFQPSLRAVPPAAVTTGGSLKLTSAASTISNTDPNSNGILVNAGGGINTTAVAGCNGSFQDFKNPSTLTGTPWQNSMIPNDTSLSTLSTNPDAMFASFFGTTLAQFQAATSTVKLNNCGTVENDFYAAYAKGRRTFYTACDFQTNNDLGTLGDPITLVTTGALKFNGGADIYGLIYGDQATWDQVGAGNGSINGAMIVRGNYCANANAQYNYNPTALENLNADSGSFIRVPGSWKDF